MSKVAEKEEVECLVLAEAGSALKVVLLDPYNVSTKFFACDVEKRPVEINFRGKSFSSYSPRAYFSIKHNGQTIDRVRQISEEASTFHLAWTLAREHGKMLRMKIGNENVSNEYSVDWDSDVSRCCCWTW